jgi:polyhydroxyalkanoate synthase
VSEHAGHKPVHVVGWSLGGIFATLTLADRPDLPAASLTIIGSPFDVRQVPLVAPFRPLVDLTRGKIITTAYQALGGAPRPLVRWAFQLSAIDKKITKPIAMVRNLDDADFLAQVEAVDRFTANMIAYPGRSFGQLYHRFYRTGEITGGTFDLEDHTVTLASLKVPVLVFAGEDDSIAPRASVEMVGTLLTGAPEVRFEMVPGGHLGMLTGRRARTTTWRILDDWVSRPAGVLGSSPKRRYSSKSSRSLKS